MPKQMRVLVFLLVAISAFMLLAACNSGNGDGGAVGTAPSTSQVQPQDPAVAAAPEGVRPSTLAPLSAPAASAPASRPADAIVGSSPVKRVVIAMVGPTDERNSNRAGTVGWQLGPMYEYVANVNPESGAYEPVLAEKWTISIDEIKFKFRDGVQFHNGGGEFTANDFAHAVDNLMHPDNVAGDQYRRNLEGVEVINDREAVVKTKVVNVTLFRNLSQFTGGFEIASLKNFEAAGEFPGLDDQAMAGTGPYQYDERSDGRYIRFKRVPYQHWRVTPDFEELELRFISEESIRLAALLAGEVHITPLATDLHRPAFDRGMSLVKGTVPAKRTMISYLCCYLNDRTDAGMGYVHPDVPMMDVKVRRALSKAIDRDALNQALFNGGGENVLVQGYNQRSDGWNPEWEQRYPTQFGYDPAAARALLAEAGFGPNNPYEVSIILLNAYRGLPEGQDIMLAVANMMRDIGVETKIEGMDNSAKSSKARAFEFDNHLDLRQTSSDLFANVFIYASQYGRTPGSFIIPRLNELHLAARATWTRRSTPRSFGKSGKLWLNKTKVSRSSGSLQ